jgi:hypothetical protein
MEICFTINGVRHCFFIPTFQWPFTWRRPGPGPINYPQFIQDAFVLASVKAAVENIGDNAVRDPALKGIASAIGALEKLAGEHASINMGG